MEKGLAVSVTLRVCVPLISGFPLLSGCPNLCLSLRGSLYLSLYSLCLSLLFTSGPLFRAANPGMGAGKLGGKKGIRSPGCV